MVNRLICSMKSCLALITLWLVTLGITVDAQQPLSPKQRVPEWAKDAIFYQIFPERFRNGDPSNDPTRESLESPNLIPDSWAITPWTDDWYARADWEKQLGDNFYENGVFHRRFGGDLQGVIDKLDYLKDLGINTIYFNPIFHARSMHKYDGNSFHHVDPHFGPDPAGDLELMSTETADPSTWKWTAADQLFLKLIEQAHRRNIRLIIDGVFNHTGRDFWAFADIAKNQQRSPYLDWYIVKQFDDPKTDQNEFKYAGWWGVDTLPEFANTADGLDLHPKPKAYVFNATRRWMDPDNDGDPSDGIDGWRLDVANEVPNKFWQDWNTLVRKLNPEAFTVAEIWSDSGDYLADCGFSSSMNYHGFAYPVKGFLIDGTRSASQFGHQLIERLTTHAPAVRFGMQNLMDSHDTDRLASMIVNARQHGEYLDAGRFDYDIGERVSPRSFKPYDVSRPNQLHRKIQRLVALFQIAYVGAPMIYYGTESGMDGADDPDDRMPMVWDDLKYQPRMRDPFGNETEPQPIQFDKKLHAYYRSLFKLRSDSDALRQGNVQIMTTDDQAQTIVFTRSTKHETMLVGINRGDQPANIGIPIRGLRRSWKATPACASNQPGTFKRDRDHAVISLPPLSGQIWRIGKPVKGTAQK